MSVSDAFAPLVTAKRLLRVARSAALATLDRENRNPFCSLVNLASLPNGSPLLLLSRLAVHTRNLLGDPRVSLLLSEAGPDDPLTMPRISLVGQVEKILETARAGARQRYLNAHPDAQMFVDFGDFAFYRVVPTAVHLVAGFGRIIDLDGADVLTRIEGADELIAAEPGAVEHMNQDHAEAIALYATRLLGAPAGDWRMTGADPDGVDLALGRRVERLAFPHWIGDATGLRKTLVELAAKARTTD